MTEVSTGYLYIRMGSAPLEVKIWIRIRIETNADPEHWAIQLRICQRPKKRPEEKLRGNMGMSENPPPPRLLRGVGTRKALA